MRDSQNPTEEVFAVLAQLRADWPKRGWSWDYRLNCVASSFGVELGPQARQAVLKSLPDEYDHRSIAGAPTLIQEIANGSGGVRTDQRLYCSSVSAHVAAYGLWWPWGDDTTISLRVGLAGYVSEGDMQRLRQDFNALE